MKLSTTYFYLIAALALGACSSKQMYEGVQSGKRSQCEKLDQPDRTKCQEASNKSYDDYERERTSKK